MARSPEDLANLALSYLVRGTIRSLDDNDPNAVQPKQHLEFAKEAVIEEFDWPECRVIAPLTEVSLTSLRGWAYAYAVPSDMVKIWSISDGSTRNVSIAYERGMSPDPTLDRAYIYTNQASAYIRYGSNRISVGRFSANVFDLIALKLAITCCLPLTKDLKLQNNLINLYSLTTNLLVGTLRSKR